MVGLSAGSGQLVSYLGREGGSVFFFLSFFSSHLSLYFFSLDTLLFRKTPIKAACCLSPAYDVSTAFEQVFFFSFLIFLLSSLLTRFSLFPLFFSSFLFLPQLEKQRPSMSSFLAGVVKKEFLEKNSEILGGVDGYEECMNAKSLHQFLQSAAPFAGFFLFLFLLLL